MLWYVCLYTFSDILKDYAAFIQEDWFWRWNSVSLQNTGNYLPVSML